ncbi:hypothetical protein [Halomonas sp. BMC6]|uniref:hypothetical protein n=1 Tax=Halomonas sp. BMC6 TaxID=3073244 RepID=UPI0030D27A00
MAMDQQYTDALKELEEVKAQRDEYRNHLAVIADMTGNKGDIGAAHEGVNAVIEELAARLKLIEFLNQQNTMLQEQNDTLAAHMKELSSNALALAAACENKADLPLHKWAVKCAMLVSRVQASVNELPSTSLTRRDALKQEEALSRLGHLLQETHFDKAPNVARVVMQVNDAINRVKQEVRPLRLTASADNDSHSDCEMECGAYGTYCKCKAEGHQ